MLTQLPSRLLTSDAPPATTPLVRRNVSFNGLRSVEGEEDDDEQPTLRERLASSNRIVEHLKPECLAKLDAILAEKGPPGVYLPSVDKFANHAHKFRGGPGARLPEDVPLSSFAKTLPLDVWSMAQATERSCGGMSSSMQSFRSMGRQSPQPPAAAGWKLVHQLQQRTFLEGNLSPGGVLPKASRQVRVAFADQSPSASSSSTSRHGPTQVHRPCWGDTWWLEEVPHGKDVRAKSESPRGSPRGKLSPMEQAKGHAERHAAIGAAANAAHACAATAATAHTGPILLNSSEAASARKQLLEASLARKQLQEEAAAISPGDDGHPSSTDCGYANTGWRLRSMEKNSLRSMARS